MTLKNKNPGNFANNPQRASEAGRKGGEVSGGNFANDREKKTANVVGVNLNHYSHCGSVLLVLL